MENFYLENSGFLLYSPSHLIFKSNFLAKLVLMFKEDVKPPFLTSERKKAYFRVSHCAFFSLKFQASSFPINNHVQISLLPYASVQPNRILLELFPVPVYPNFWTCFPSADTFIFFAVHTEWVLKLREELPLWKLYLWFESTLGPHPSHGTMCLEMTTMTLKGTG